MNDYEVLKERTIDMVAGAKNQRVLPIDLTQTLTEEFDVSPFVISEALEDLIEEGELVYAYRDPFSYLEFPCNGCDGGHRAARPMRYFTDKNGHGWLCDADNDGFPGSACWECGSMSFTRSS